MAESIVKVVLGKLADVVVQEALSLYGVGAQVATVSSELGMIQAFLKDADKKQITDETQKQWVKEVRDVAYSIEDAIDIFLSEIPPKSFGMMGVMKRMIKKIKNLPAAHKLVNEINQIQTRMKEIETSRLRYGINNLGEDTGDIKLPVRPPVLPDLDPDVVGFKKDQDHVVRQLLDENTKRRSVISIWGAGGLGKTTLALKVYNSNDVKSHFGLRIWIAISQKFELIDVLRKIAEQLQPPIDPSNQPKGAAFLTKIHECLTGKKYLMVFDDVWTNDLWTKIGVALPDENNGSRVFITTRFLDVAKDADPTCEPYKLEFLTNELSLELLCKKALPNQEPNKSVFDDLSGITNQFVQKCGGLPIALVVLGGLLSKKPCNYMAWSKVLQTLSWDVDGKTCSEIIGASYEHLPFALKSCFMYFAAFPEDYNINAENLIRMWVAEGFIPQEENRTLEETAESFLEDLVQRSMVHVKSRSTNGSIEYCGIHDLLRDLVVRKAKEDNFLIVYSHPDDHRSLSSARRVAVHNPDCDELEMSQNLHTLLYFGNKCMPNCSKQRLLKVVSTGNSKQTEININMFKRLTLLRYLYLHGYTNDNCQEQHLKKVICDNDLEKAKGSSEKVIRYKSGLEKVICSMKFLQTLDTYNYKSNDNALPDFTWHIKTLRHVIPYPTSLPPSTKLANLQTLKFVKTKEWKTELPHLPNLRTLELWHCSSSWGLVVAFLGTLRHLISLNLTGPFSLDIIDMRDFPFYQHLQSLELNTFMQNTPIELAIDLIIFPPHLTSLSIYNYSLQQDVMLVLEKLHYLKKLILWDACTNKKMSCSAKGFSQLEVLNLCWLNLLEDWEIEEGAMPVLRELTIRSCSQLCVPQGLRHLTNLQKLTCRNNKDMTDRADEVRKLCKHVPSIIIYKW